MRTAWLLVLAAGLLPASRGGGQQPAAQRPTPQRTAVQPDSALARRASSHLRAGRADSAQLLYGEMLRTAGSRGDSARALYGGAFARQQTAALDTAGAVDAIVRDYTRAQQLDPKAAEWAQYNIATVYSSAGRHREAAQAFVAASRTHDSLRPTLQLRAGREFVAAGDWNSAVPLLAEAARNPRTRSDAQGELLELYGGSQQIDSIIAVAGRLQGDAAPRSTASAVLLGAMLLPEWKESKSAEACLILLAKNYAAMDLGPTYFATAQLPELNSALAVIRGTSLEPGLAALRDVYLPRDSNGVYRPVKGSAWWLENTERHTAWSSTLRALGDWYDRAGYARVGLSFFEAAIGLPDRFDIGAPWIDLQALPPLAALYATSRDDSHRQNIARIGQFAEAVFMGKGDAYAKGDWGRIRQFHLTLGTLYAMQGKWGGGVIGGIFQVEHLRSATNELRRRGLDLHDPPKLLELLATEYRRRGCRVEGKAVALQARQEYLRMKSPEAAARMDRLLQSLADMPPATRPASCSAHAG